MTVKKLISISIPVLNEAENLRPLYERLDTLSKSLRTSYDFEFVFTDNASTDSTWEGICRLSQQDKRVKAYRFTKNVGFQKSILMNYSFTRGDAVVQIDADLQDPPELIARFIEEWEADSKIVYGLRVKRQEGLLNGLFRRIGYWVVDKLSNHPIPHGAGDFRLLDRGVVDSLLAQNNPQPYIRGTLAAMGFRSIGVPYDRSARESGSSKFPISKLIRLGVTGILENSVLPLRFAVFFGVFLLIVSFALGAWTVVSYFINPNLPVGYASIFSVMLFGFGANAMLTGIVGEYILRIYVTLRGEPLAYIAESVNAESF